MVALTTPSCAQSVTRIEADDNRKVKFLGILSVLGIKLSNFVPIRKESDAEGQ